VPNVCTQFVLRHQLDALTIIREKNAHSD